jgi:hypothetical protein
MVAHLSCRNAARPARDERDTDASLVDLGLAAAQTRGAVEEPALYAAGGKGRAVVAAEHDERTLLQPARAQVRQDPAHVAVEH